MCLPVLELLAGEAIIDLVVLVGVLTVATGQGHPFLLLLLPFLLLAAPAFSMGFYGGVAAVVHVYRIRRLKLFVKAAVLGMQVILDQATDRGEGNTFACRLVGTCVLRILLCVSTITRRSSTFLRNMAVRS